MALSPYPSRQTAVTANQSERKSNNTGSCTLLANATNTVVQDARVWEGAVIVLVPATATALTAMPTCLITPSEGAFTITHTNTATTTRRFRYVVHGIG